MYQVWLNPLTFTQVIVRKRKLGVSRADNFVKIWQNLLISNPRSDLYNINAHTKFDENPLMFTQVIIRKRNTDGRTEETDRCRTDGRTDRHKDIQRETIIPRHCRVAGYKAYEPKAYKLCVSLKNFHIQLYQLPLVGLIPQLVSCFTFTN